MVFALPFSKVATSQKYPVRLPILPIRNAVVFPSVSMPLLVGRPKSIQALEEAESGDGLVIIVSQKVLTSQDPEPTDLYSVGTLCKIENISTNDTGGRQVIVTGIARYRLGEIDTRQGSFIASHGEVVSDVRTHDQARHDALFLSLKEVSRQILELLPGATEPLVKLIDRVEDSSNLAHICAAYLNLTVQQKQELLETVQVEQRMEILLNYMQKERETLNLQKEIRDKMSERINKAQREALLREQLHTIQTELGEEATEEAADDLSRRLIAAHLPEEASRQSQEELKRLKSLPPNSAEYHVIRTYLEWLAALPWDIRSPSHIDLDRARQILAEDHYGLEAVKKRILQFLAVAKLKNDLRGPILCLIGPPGVGKTSLGQSIARALDRKFVRASLGGVRDEAEIRGHRRTYVGAMPGRIIQSIKRAGARNPVMMLDEIDKLRADFHGDPSAAMLEVLDPEQNRTFADHYIDVPFDLSDVFFIATGNIVDTIPPALLDRMEIIEINGYTSFEKMHIARKHLIPKQMSEHGIKPEWIHLPDDTIQRMITHYTREAGVRELQRKIAALFRAAAQEVVERGDQQGEKTYPPISLTENRLDDLLGPERFLPETVDRVMKPGVATGLAWTPQGGDILFIEVSALSGGKGNFTLTGQLGDVMKESAQIALSLARSDLLKVARNSFDFSKTDIHIHVPAGAIQKDGPSAGITLLVALISLITGRSVHPKLGLTGEITLRGLVLPVGGIKEKVLAAHRAGLETVVMPERNQKDLRDVPAEVLEQLKIIPIHTVDELFALSELFAPLEKKEEPPSVAA